MFPVGEQVTIKGSPDRYDSRVNRITQDEKTLKLEYGKFDARTIHLDRSSHPQNLQPTPTGHSIGRWENDVLIVHTVGVRAGSLTRGIVHSDALELTERFALDRETQSLKRGRLRRSFAALSEINARLVCRTPPFGRRSRSRPSHGRCRA